LTALLSRLSSTWRTRTGSPAMKLGTPAPMPHLSVSRFSRALTVIAGRVSSSRPGRSKGMFSMRSLPASIFEKSRMSLMMVSSASAELLTICR
jgi:hypothetical protein